MKSSKKKNFYFSFRYSHLPSRLSSGKYPPILLTRRLHSVCSAMSDSMRSPISLRIWCFKKGSSKNKLFSSAQPPSNASQTCLSVGINYPELDSHLRQLCFPPISFKWSSISTPKLLIPVAIFVLRTRNCRNIFLFRYLDYAFSRLFYYEFWCRLIIVMFRFVFTQNGKREIK